MTLLLLSGEEVKALGEGVVGGTLVRFSGPNSPDESLWRDFFTKSTDFDVTNWPAESSVYYHHGRDKKVGKRRLTRGTMSLKDNGIEIEAQLDMTDTFQASLYRKCAAGEMGWSSGSAPHLVERVKVGNTHMITKWPLGLDASITPSPADSKNVVRALKALDEEDTEGVLPFTQWETKASETLLQLGSLLEEAEWIKAERAKSEKPLSWAMWSRITEIQSMIERLRASVEPIPGGNQVLHGLADLKIMDLKRQQSHMDYGY